MKKTLSFVFVASLLALFAISFTSGVASAHEVRNVDKYSFVVGFLNEPAFAQQQNSLDLTICNGKCQYNPDWSVKNGVTGAEKTLQFEVSMGSAPTLKLPISAAWGKPGKYESFFLPSKTGAYTFHIFGTLEGKSIDEKFTSGPDTFGEARALQVYPAVNTAVNDQNTASITSLQNQVQEAKNSASTATTFGIVGSILGILGLGAAAFALLRRSARTSDNTTTTREPVDSLRG